MGYEDMPKRLKHLIRNAYYRKRKPNMVKRRKPLTTARWSKKVTLPKVGEGE
jgi:hypothetical protein